ncbi:hypothetical protein JEZ13_05870 [bacterium]|nr:hypothetical protein [bacterium]
MYNSNEDRLTKNSNSFWFSKSMFWLQFIFFGGWNGIQILLQPQELSVFIYERGLHDNYFVTVSYLWNNIPLLVSLFLSIGIVWNYFAISFDYKYINDLKKSNNIGVIPYRDKDNIVVFITAITMIVWFVCFFVLYQISILDFNFITNLIYGLAGSSKIKFMTYVLILLFTISLNFFLRIQMLLFFEGGYEHQALIQLFKSFITMKAYYIKLFFVNMLVITVSVLIYKQIILDLVIKYRTMLPEGLLIRIPLLVTRNDIVINSPSIIVLFLVSSLLFSPLIIYLYQKLINYQFDFYKMLNLKLKIKKVIDENS